MTRLLFDQNVSPKLTHLLRDIFHGSIHVSQIGLAKASDFVVREYALRNELILVSKDADFSELGLLLGFPPKVIWIRHGNCSTKAIEILFRENKTAIELFAADDENNVLALM